MVSPITLLSRVVHQTCMAILVGGSVLVATGHAHMTAENGGGKLMTIAGVAAFISGLYNAGAARPSRMGSQAMPWRAVIYGLKIPLFLSLTPLLEKVCPAEFVAPVRAGGAISMVALSSFIKFYREDVLSAKADKEQ